MTMICLVVLVADGSIGGSSSAEAAGWNKAWNCWWGRRLMVVDIVIWHHDAGSKKTLKVWRVVGVRQASNWTVEGQQICSGVAMKMMLPVVHIPFNHHCSSLEVGDGTWCWMMLCLSTGWQSWNTSWLLFCFLLRNPKFDSRLVDHGDFAATFHRHTPFSQLKHDWLAVRETHLCCRFGGSFERVPVLENPSLFLVCTPMCRWLHDCFCLSMNTFCHVWCQTLWANVKAMTDWDKGRWELAGLMSFLWRRQWTQNPQSAPLAHFFDRV